jgi:integrase
MACSVKKNRHGNLAFRLYWNGIESWEGTGLKDNAKNRQRMEARSVLISEEMEKGTFDYLKWFPNGNKAYQFKTELDNKETPQTIRQYYETWKKDKVPPFVKKTRGRKYRSHFEAHILPFQGDLYLHHYAVTDIRDIRLYLVEAKRLSIKTVKNIVNASLRALFRDAKAEGIIEENPFDELPPKWWPKRVSPPPNPFTEEQRDQIIAYFFEKYWQKWRSGCVFLFASFWTGPRPSEFTPRRWKDYDPRTGKLGITSSRSEGEEGATKTENSNRTITLLTPVREYLEQIRPLDARPDDYIFLNQRGKPIDQKEFAERHFWPALRALNIAHRDFYAVRDTFISTMLSHGEPAKRVAEHCGTSLEMIEGSYGKYIGADREFGAEALKAAKPKPEPKPPVTVEADIEEIPVVGVVRGGGFEPPRHFWH